MSRMLAVGLCVLSGLAGATETMRIAVVKEAQEVRLSAKGLVVGPDREDGPFVPLALDWAHVTISGGRIQLNGVAWPRAELRFRAGVEALDSGVPGSQPVHVGSTVLSGDVVVRRSGQGLGVVNVIPLEDYLLGVLGSEMPGSYPVEALKAQAVASRTYALHKKLRSIDEPSHLGADVLSQVYGGLRAADDRSRAAVEATRGWVLTFELAPVEAYFHASCGGQTESGADALGRDLPYLRSVRCACAGLAASRWKYLLPQRELDQVAGSRSRRGALSVQARTPTGRARRVGLAPGGGMDAVQFRERVGYSKVKSLAFTVSQAKGAYALHGKGLGHGAGLCQWGAKAYAEQGWTYQQILAHYYAGTELQALY